jgi:hypothetical protein
MNLQRRRSFFDGFRERPGRYLLHVAACGLVIAYGVYRTNQGLDRPFAYERVGPFDWALFPFGVCVGAAFLWWHWRQPKPPPVGPEAARQAGSVMTWAVVSVSTYLACSAGILLMTPYLWRSIGNIFPGDVPYVIGIGSGLAAMFCAFAVWSWRSHRAARRRYRVATGCCAACGYSLRGLPTPRCPECGTVSEHPPPPAAPPDPDEPRG